MGWTRALSTLCLIATGWVGVAAGTALIGPFDTMAVPLSRPGLISRLPDGVSITGARSGVLVLRGEGPGLARDLYRAGAIVVLPAREKTCLDLRGLRAD